MGNLVDKKIATSAARLVKTCYIFLSYIFCDDNCTISQAKLRRCNGGLLYDDSSSTSESSDKDMLDEIFVDALFPDHKHDYPRVNIEDLSESQCETMFR